MILSDRDIPYGCATPFLLSNLNGASLDLRIGSDVWLEPKEFMRSFTLEVVHIPIECVGFVCGKSSWARDGLIVESAGLIDPGFEGQIVLELFNQTSDHLFLWEEQRICQMYLIKLSSPAIQNYKNVGHYYGQTGAQGAWWHHKEEPCGDR